MSYMYTIIITIDVLQFDVCVAINSSVKLCGNSAQKGSVTAASFRTSLCPNVQPNMHFISLRYSTTTGFDVARPGSFSVNPSQASLLHRQVELCTA